MKLLRTKQAWDNIFLYQYGLDTALRDMCTAPCKPAAAQVNPSSEHTVKNAAIFQNGGKDQAQDKQDIHANRADYFSDALRSKKQVLQKRENQQICKTR